MNKTKVLIVGYSSFARRRLIPSLANNKFIDYCICSKSSKIQDNNKVLFNNLNKALKDYNPKIVYISTVNSHHFIYAKKVLEKGFNTIVDKPATLNLKKTKELIKIAEKKKVLFAESTLFNYHRVFQVIKNLCKGFKSIEHIQSNLNHPLIRTPIQIKKIQGDCESDMSPYAAAIIRIFMGNKFQDLSVNKNYFRNSKVVKNFYLKAYSKSCTYFGNFAFQREYSQQIIFYTKDRTIYSPQRVFALPKNNNIEIILKNKNKTKRIKVKKDDCIRNFFNLILKSLKKKNYDYFYNIVLNDAIIRNKIKINRID